MRRRASLVAGAVVAVALFLFLLLVPTGLFWNALRPALHKDVINRYAAVYKFDPLFVMALVKVESGFARDALSHRGAVGLMQLMPDTGMEMARRAGLQITSPDQLAAPEVNIHLGIHYLSLLRDEFQDDTTAILAAYNAGPTNARAWKGPDALTEDEIQYPETRLFVQRVASTQRWLRRFQKVKNVFA